MYYNACGQLESTDIFMDSSGVGLVMGRYRYATTLGKKGRVDNLDDRNYKITNIDAAKFDKKLVTTRESFDDFCKRNDFHLTTKLEIASASLLEDFARIYDKIK